jgi:hypothetical protein
MFQDRESLELLLADLPDWSHWRHGLLAVSCFEWLSLAEPFTEEEQQERDAFANYREWFDREVGDIRPAIQRALGSSNKRVRYRGYLAACCYGGPAVEYLKAGLDDAEDELRGACLIMIARHVSTEELVRICDTFRGDLGVYGSKTIQSIAEDLIAHAESGVTGSLALDEPEVSVSRSTSDARLIPPHLTRVPLPKAADYLSPSTNSFQGAEPASRAYEAISELLQSDNADLKLASAIALTAAGYVTIAATDEILAHFDRGSYNMFTRQECARTLVELASEDSNAQSLVVAFLHGQTDLSILEALGEIEVESDELISLLRERIIDVIENGEFFGDCMLIDRLVTAFKRSGGQVDEELREILVGMLLKAGSRDWFDLERLAHAIEEAERSNSHVDDAIRTLLDVDPASGRLIEGSDGNARALWLARRFGIAYSFWQEQFSQNLNTGYAGLCRDAVMELVIRRDEVVEALRLSLADNEQTTVTRLEAAVALLRLGQYTTETLQVIADGPNHDSRRHVVDYRRPNIAAVISDSIVANPATGDDLLPFLKRIRAHDDSMSWRIKLIGATGRSDSSVVDFLSSVVRSDNSDARLAAIEVLSSLGYDAPPLERLVVPMFPRCLMMIDLRWPRRCGPQGAGIRRLPASWSRRLLKRSQVKDESQP